MIEQITQHTEQDWYVYAGVMIALQVLAWLCAFSFGQMTKTEKSSRGSVRARANIMGATIIIMGGLWIVGLTLEQIAFWAIVNCMLYQLAVEFAFAWTRANRDKRPALYWMLRPHSDRRRTDSTETNMGRRDGDDHTPTRF